MINEKKPDFALDPHALQRTALIVRALNHPFRQRILKALHQAESLRVMELCTCLAEIEPIVSQHLGVLRQAGLVYATKKGRSVYYALYAERVKEVERKVNELLKEK